VANYPVGPIFDGAGLNMTVMSYQENLDFGLLACPDVLPDVWSLADGLADALAEVSKAAEKVGAIMSSAPCSAICGRTWRRTRT
jgi:hypothetical protein